MPDEREARFRDLQKRLHEHYERVNSQLSFFGTINSCLADEHLEESDALKKHLTEVEKDWQNGEDSQEIDLHMTDVVFPYFTNVLDSLSARIEIARAGVFRDSRERFQLFMKSEALQMQSLDNVVEAYHNAAEEFLGLQKEVKGLELHSVNIGKADEYMRETQSFTRHLDQLATQTFRTKIFTSSNLDLKERNPHHFLGQINIGFEGFIPELIRVISHEGPFGHNTQAHLTETEKSAFTFPYRHASEGLAILGEGLALGLFYPPEAHEDNEALVRYQKCKRRFEDSVSASFAKLAYHDRRSAEEIAEELDSPLVMKELTLQNLDGLERRREATFSFGAVPYFVGADLISKTYNDAVDVLRGLATEEKPFEEYQSELLNVMFTGHRSADVIGAQVKEYLKTQKGISKKKGMDMKPEQYGYSLSG